MSDANKHLMELARRVADAYAALPETCAIIVMGSVAEGHADHFSDLDMAVYYGDVPSEDALAAARTAAGGSERNWFVGDRESGRFAESFRIDGIECQVAQATIEAWERDMAVVLEVREVGSPLQKALSGTLTALPLYGDELVRGWKAKAVDYPDALARAMVEKYLNVFPVWTMPERFLERDATLWLHQILVEAEQNLLGVLAGVNRLYYTTFQFKRQDAFVAQMRIAPPDLSSRLKGLLVAEPAAAIGQLQELVRQVVEIVEGEMPGVDTAGIRRQLGFRVQPWAAVNG